MDPVLSALPAGATARTRVGALHVLLRPHRRLLAVTIFFGIADQGLALTAAGVGAYLVGRAATGASVAELRDGLIVLALLVVPKPVTGWLESFMAHDMAFRILLDLRQRLFGAIERLAPSYLFGKRSGDVGAMAMGDIELVELFFAHTLSPLVVATVIPAGALVALGLIDPYLALALFPSIVAVASIPAWFRRRAAADGRALRSANAELSGEAVDSVQGLREVVMFGQHEPQLDRLDAAGSRLARAQIAHHRRAGTERGALDGLTAVGLLVTVATAAVLVSHHHVPASAYPLVVVLAGYAFVPLTTVLTTARELGAVAAAGTRLVAVLETPAVVEEPQDPVRVSGVAGDVHFQHVTFRYSPQLPVALEDVTLDIPVGSTVALVGHSGAGKSTCASLLLRWWDPESGQVTLGGSDLKTLRQGDLHRLVSLVPQDTYLFNVSVAENIRIARPDATDAEVVEAAKATQCHEFIEESLPEGYDTIVGERGARLSGGQRQRIAIARALLGEAPVLVLDEAVSNVDLESETALDEAMRTVRRGRTTLVIAHRRSTIQSANLVVLLDHGHVVDVGHDAELSKRNPTYRRLLGLTDEKGPTSGT